MNNNENGYNIDKVTVNDIDITHEYCGTTNCCGDCDTAVPVQLELFNEEKSVSQLLQEGFEEEQNDREDN